MNSFALFLVSVLFCCQLFRAIHRNFDELPHYAPDCFNPGRPSLRDFTAEYSLFPPLEARLIPHRLDCLNLRTRYLLTGSTAIVTSNVALECYLRGDLFIRA